MKKAFYYLLYRILKLYDDSGTSKFWIEPLGYSALFVSFGFFASSLAMIIFNVRLENVMNLFHYIMLPLFAIGVYMVWNDEDIYDKLKVVYKDESHQTLKNIFTILYILTGPIIFGIVLFATID
jgi:DMSO reductase anchor subunit